MNKRKGFKRLAWALGVPYFGFWALVYHTNNNAWLENQKVFRQHIDADNYESAKVWARAYAENMDWMITSLTWGLVVPVIAAIVAGIAYWVYRGFKPKE